MGFDRGIDAFSANGKRIINQVTVVDTFGNYANAALRQYARLHKMYPESELYIVHTKRPYLDIKVRFWTGVRPHKILS